MNLSLTSEGIIFRDQSLIKSCSHWECRNSAAVVLNLAYGWKVTQNDDYFIRVMQEGVALSAILSQPGRWLVEVIPSCMSSFYYRSQS